MKKKSQFNDFMNVLFPSLIVKKNNYVNQELADKLFEIWKDDRNMVSSDVYRRPMTLSKKDVDGLSKDGLIQEHGSKIKITKKGKEILKVMVLGDERSVFEDDGSNINHHEALAHTKTPMSKSAKKMAQYYENQWFKRFEE